MDDKIIVTNRAALIAKYGAAGFTAIKKSVAALVAADATRGIKSRLVLLDDATAMKRYKGKPVTDSTNTRQAKEAIDAIFRSADPDYLMILGAPDVIPHGDMINPLFSSQDDDDKLALGDLPYACDTGFSRDIATFKGPNRVIGRLPDLTGATDPKYLLKLLDVTAKQKSRKVTDYATYFGLSTHTWQKSSALSLQNMFGNSTRLTISPPNGPTHPAARLSPLSHFINCHGGPSDPSFLVKKVTRCLSLLPANQLRERSNRERSRQLSAVLAPKCTTP